MFDLGRTGTAQQQTEELYPAVPGLPGALPELSNNFFNLEPGHIPLPSMPPPPSIMVPPMFGPPPLPPFFFNHGPPQLPSFTPPVVSSAAPSTVTTSSTAPSGVTDVTAPPPKTTVHYPSQDPNRMGAIQRET